MNHEGLKDIMGVITFFLSIVGNDSERLRTRNTEADSKT
jgi:hypothetical protein